MYNHLSLVLRVRCRVILRWEGGGGDYREKTHGCVRRPITLAVRLFMCENGVKQYEWVLFMGLNRVPTTAVATFVETITQTTPSPPTTLNIFNRLGLACRQTT